MRIDSAKFLNIKTEAMELLRNMEIGDTLKGRVLEVLGNNISIRASGGQVFTAVLPEGTTVPKGSLVELLINNISVDGKLYAEFKTEARTEDMDSKVAGLLKQFGLPVDEKNLEAAKLLVKYNLPLDKDSVTKITNMQKSVDNLNMSGEEKAALMLSGLNIKNTPVDVLNKLVLNWTGELPEDAAEKTQVDTVNGNNIMSAGVQAEENLQGPTAKPAADTTVAANKPEIINDDVDIQETASNELHKTAAKAEAVGVKPEQTANKETLIREAVRAGFNAASAELEAADGSELLKALTKLGVEPGAEVGRLAGQVESILSSIRNTDMEALTYLVSKEMSITPANLGMLIRNIENKDGVSSFLDLLQKKIEGENSPELKEVKEAIKKVFLEPGQLEDSKEVSEKLKDIAQLGEKLEGYLSEKGGKDPEIRDALSNLRDSLDFIRNINQQANYMQLPLLINGDTSTAKLYVFKEGKRSRQINPEDATVVVALDLKSLGHLESMIKVKGKTVNVTFRVESKEAGTILEKNSNMLKKALKEKGYSLNPVRVVNTGQPFSLLSLEAAINESTSDKINFDMRV